MTHPPPRSGAAGRSTAARPPRSAFDPARVLADRLIALLSRQRPGSVVQASLCVGLVLVCAAVRAALPLNSMPYLMFVPAVFTLSLMFGVGAGLAATILSAALAALLFLAPPFSLRLNTGQFIATGLFVLFSTFISIVCDAVRRSALNQEAELRRYRALEAAAAASARALNDSEARLVDERARLAALVEHLPVGVGFVDLAGRSLLSNPALRRLDPLGDLTTLREDARERWRAWDAHGEPVAWENHPVARVLRGEIEAGVESLAAPASAQPIWVHISGVPLCGPGGEVQAALLVVMDVDEQKRAREALHRLNETLELRVSERTAELEHAQDALRQAQKMEALGQLTGGIAHDFNNLLTAISGSLELLTTRLAQGRAQDGLGYVEVAKAASSRAAALTHRLLAFARRQALDPRPIDVDRLVAGMEELIRRTVGPAIEVASRLDGRLWTTLVDPHQLENALLNLCINARDAMPSGGRLIIETSNVVRGAGAGDAENWPPGDYVALSVTDTGVGMSPEVLARVFEPFFTTKPLGQGTGLGLSMVYGFVLQSGGKVQVRSTPGEGSTVTLYLPRQSGAPLGEDKPAAAERSPSGSGKRVLVIDDEVTVRMVVVQALADAGYTALEACDGRSGLEIFRTGEGVDLLITDLGLPGGMSGLQVAEIARGTAPDLQVLFITGYPKDGLEGRGARTAGAELLAKPFTLEALRAKVSQMLGAR